MSSKGCAMSSKGCALSSKGCALSSKGSAVSMELMGDGKGVEIAVSSKQPWWSVAAAVSSSVFLDFFATTL